MEEVSVNYAGGEYIKKKVQVGSRKASLVFKSGLCFSLSFFCLFMVCNNIEKEEKLTKGFSALSSPPASALIDAGIKYALTSADDHRHCHLSLRLS